ncbi:DUF5994 family protein [Streptomyces lydicus]|uniref:DUF5994 family protein n=1 Tax=Streptomyces lydicus TaxID=47763 RepID=UPI003799330A
MLPNRSTAFVWGRSPKSLFPRPTAPSAVRLTLEPTLARAGMFDGAWWPHSRDVRAELPGLITALSAHLGAILRVGLDQDAWDDIPRSLTIDGRGVHIGWFTASDDTMSVTRGLNDHFMLLVVPPWASAPAAAAAMAMAARTGNRMPAATILAASGTTPEIPDAVALLAVDAEGERIWEAEGGAAVPV